MLVFKYNEYTIFSPNYVIICVLTVFCLNNTFIQYLICNNKH